MSLNTPAFIANGTILPSRFVKLDATKDFAVIQGAAATDSLIGISQEGTKDAPGVVGAGTDAASAGETLKVFGQGDVCLLEAGAAIVRGARLTSDATGRGVTAAPAAGANNGIGAVALQSAAAAGEKIRVQVLVYSLQG